MSTRAERFEAAYSAFQPEPDDDPTAIPFYRAFEGLRAAWGPAFANEFNHIVHHAACMCGGRAPGEGYRKACSVLASMCDAMSYPPDPYHQSCYDAEPRTPTEDDAREIFKLEFKLAFPGRRWRSKFGEEKWEEVKVAATAIVEGRYRAAKAAHDEEVARIEDGNARRRAEWEEKRRRIDEAKAAAEEILKP